MNKPAQILELEKIYKISINESKVTYNRNSYSLNSKGEIVSLDLSLNNISDISTLKSFKSLTHLNLNTNKIVDISVLKNLPLLT
ncbi:leucine-rich repeat domain-containing protein, partial [Flavobacterium artemisiae]